MSVPSLTAPLYFSRAHLRQDASVGALLPLLGLGRSDGGQVNPRASHALVWSLFADSAERNRDFLYREAEDGQLYILSLRPPEDRHALFELDSKPYEPNLEPGDRLAFSLRANAVVRRKVEGKKHSVKDDIVMRALFRDGKASPRSGLRPRLIRELGSGWLERIAARSGFAVVPERLAVEGYRQHSIPRGGKGKPIRFTTLDFEGLLSVTEPELFIASVASGFGAARAFGCGLMLLRRA